jgi:hypothetical protein
MKKAPERSGNLWKKIGYGGVALLTCGTLVLCVALLRVLLTGLCICFGKAIYIADGNLMMKRNPENQQMRR